MIRLNQIIDKINSQQFCIPTNPNIPKYHWAMPISVADCKSTLLSRLHLWDFRKSAHFINIYIYICILDLFLTSNPSIYSPPTVSQPLGNSDHSLITVRHDFLPLLDSPFTPQRVFHYSKADWDSLCTFYSSYPWSSGFSNDPSSLASFITDAILLGMDLFIPSS